MGPPQEFPCRDPCRACRVRRRRRSRSSARVSAGALLAPHIAARGRDLRRALPDLAGRRATRRHRRSALPRRLEAGERDELPAGGVNHLAACDAAGCPTAPGSLQEELVCWPARRVRQTQVSLPPRPTLSQVLAAAP